MDEVMTQQVGVLRSQMTGAIVGESSAPRLFKLFKRA